MPLPMIVARQAWPLLRTAHMTLQQWKKLPPERQVEMRSSMQRVGPLVVELSGSLRQRQEDPSRPLNDVMAELGVALGELRMAAPELAPEFGPRTRRERLAVRAAKSVGSVAARKASGLRSPGEISAGIGLDEPGGEGELDVVVAAFADIAADESLRVAQFDVTRPSA